MAHRRASLPVGPREPAPRRCWHEYLYVDLDRRLMAIPASTLPVVFSTSTAFREQLVRVGLNYHFNWTGPVVAKY